MLYKGNQKIGVFKTVTVGGVSDVRVDGTSVVNNGIANITMPTIPTPPTVNNSTITIQKNGVDAGDFDLNQSSPETINISVPTKTSDLQNDSNYITQSDISGLGINYVESQVTLSTVTSIGNHTLNFSNYLPNDGKSYLVFLNGYLKTSMISSGNNTSVYLSNPNINIRFLSTGYADLSTIEVVNNCIIKVDTNRTLTMTIQDKAATSLSVSAYGYMKLG